MDRNIINKYSFCHRSEVALRKESVDRNTGTLDPKKYDRTVALRKESVDRNTTTTTTYIVSKVALRKESVDRNYHAPRF